MANQFDHWCDRCYVETPLVLRSRKTSRAEHKKLKARQEVAKTKIAARRAEKLVKQEAVKAATKITGKTPTTTKYKSPVAVGESPFLDYEFSGVRDQLIYEKESLD